MNKAVLSLAMTWMLSFSVGTACAASSIEIADELYSDSRYLEAATYYEKSYEEALANPVSDKLEVFASRNMLAGTYSILGRTVEADRLFEKSKDELESLDGYIESKVAAYKFVFFNQYGVHLSRSNRKEEAILAHTQAIDFLEKSDNKKKRSERANAYFNIAANYERSGDLKSAEESYIKAWDEMSVADSIKSVSDARLQARIGAKIGKLYVIKKKPDDAMFMYEQSVAVLDEHNQRSHTDYATILVYQAELLEEVGEKKSAARKLEAALEVFRKNLGYEHPTTIFVNDLLQKVEQERF